MENIINYKDAVFKISTTKQKLKQKDYLKIGEIPVIDQGQDLIGGYTDDMNKVIKCKLPVIVFGDHTKNVKLINFSFAPGADGTKVLQPKKGIIPAYLAFITEVLVFKIKDKGYARHYQHIEKQSFPLPPLPIQRAIVSKIESLFSSLDNGIADLKKAQEQLKIYRQATLKKAFEGELTKEWREQQTDLPSADELLEQIKVERQKYYDKQLEEWSQRVRIWEESGKVGKKPTKLNVYKYYNSAVQPLDFKTPICWLEICLGNLCSKTEYGSSSKSHKEGMMPVLRMGNMQNGKIDWTDLKFSNNKEEIKQYKLRMGDVLFNRTNSPELVGKTVVYKGEREALFAGYLIRLNHLKSILSSDYINYFLNSHPAKVYGAKVKTDGVNQSNINGEKLANYPIPYTSIEEQHQIVKEIEIRFSVCDQVELDIYQSLDKAKALRQSILKKAFEGKLLSKAEIEKCKQEVDYEPASVLLERIKNEKKN